MSRTIRVSLGLISRNYMNMFNNVVNVDTLVVFLRSSKSKIGNEDSEGNIKNIPRKDRENIYTQQRT